jgi:ribose transport system ATP-binding protein
MSHRVVVMADGRITGVLSAAEANQEAIMRLATHRDEAVIHTDNTRKAELR